MMLKDLDLVMLMDNLIQIQSMFKLLKNNRKFMVLFINSFKTFMFNAKLLGNTAAQPNLNQAVGILKNGTIE